MPRRPALDDLDVLARVPHPVPYCPNLRRKRSGCVAHNPGRRERADAVRPVRAARQENAYAEPVASAGCCRGRDRVSGGASPKKQKDSYSGKKKRHTQKAQVLIERASGRIVATAFAADKVHDFALFKESRTALPPQTECLADSGYLGLVKRHANSRLPHKRSQLHPLTEKQKAENRSLSKERFVVEHVIRSLKIFRILAERYRNRRKRFGLRFNLIAALHNHELDD